MNESVLFLGAGQGLLLCLAMIGKSFRKGRFYLFPALVYFVFFNELSVYWLIKTGTLSSVVFPFWIFSSYLFLPVALDAILMYLKKPYKGNFSVQIKLLVIGLLEVCFNTAKYFFPDLEGFALFTNGFWDVFTQILPIIWFWTVLMIHFDRSNKNKSYWITYALFLSLILIWMFDFLFPGIIFSVVQIFLISLLFVSGYVAYTFPDLIKPKIPSTLDKQYEGQNHMEVIKDYEAYLILEEAFIQSDLKLNIVAERLGISPKYLSWLINKSYKMNFRQHLNYLRVNRIIERLKKGEYKALTLLAIAYESGYNSKSSFNSAFKEQTGKTPSDYLKELEGKKSEN